VRREYAEEDVEAVFEGGQELEGIQDGDGVIEPDEPAGEEAEWDIEDLAYSRVQATGTRMMSTSLFWMMEPTKKA
jgi:hypothetical protein